VDGAVWISSFIEKICLCRPGDRFTIISPYSTQCVNGVRVK
jgi:hypothetical protein